MSKNKVTVDGFMLFDGISLESEQGKLFINAKNEVFILGCVKDEDYCLISFEDGNRWANPSSHYGDIFGKTTKWRRLRTSVNIDPGK